MIVAVPVTPEEDVDPRWGKANQIAVADVADGEIKSWQVQDTDWQRLHDEGPHGTHHGRVARFLIDNKVEMVVIDHAGEPMLNTMTKMKITIVLEAHGPAREAVLAAAEAQS